MMKLLVLGGGFYALLSVAAVRLSNDAYLVTDFGHLRRTSLVLFLSSPSGRRPLSVEHGPHQSLSTTGVQFGIAVNVHPVLLDITLVPRQGFLDKD